MATRYFEVQNDKLVEITEDAAAGRPRRAATFTAYIMLTPGEVNQEKKRAAEAQAEKDAMAAARTRAAEVRVATLEKLAKLGIDPADLKALAGE